MPKDNTSKDKERPCSEALNEPKTPKNHSPCESKEEGPFVHTLDPSSSKDTKQEIPDKSKDLKDYVVEIATPNNSRFNVFGPASQDIEIEGRELYQINNFLR